MKYFMMPLLTIGNLKTAQQIPALSVRKYYN